MNDAADTNTSGIAPPDMTTGAEVDRSSGAMPTGDDDGASEGSLQYPDARRVRLHKRIEEIEEELTAAESGESRSGSSTKQQALSMIFVFAAASITIFMTFYDSPNLAFLVPVAVIVSAAALPILRFAEEGRGAERQHELRAELRERITELEGLEKRRREPVDQFVDINLDNMEKYYHLVSSHTNRSFRLTLVAAAIGFVLLSAGLVAGFLVADERRTTAFLTAGAGMMINFISAVFFVLYRRTVSELKTYHERLLRVQNTLIAFRYVEKIGDDAERSRTLSQMVSSLIAHGVPPPSQKE